MSKRFQRWVETWIDENVSPHVNVDVETYDARAQRLTKKLLSDALGGGFPKFEIEEERDRVLRLVHKAVSDSTDFDPDAYRLKWQLAMEHEDGD